MKRYRLMRLSALALLVVLTQSVCAFTVVIDPGHGGKDPGACGAITTEKKLNLDVALKLRSLIKGSCPDIKVVMTRSTDEFIELQKRADIANSNNADLFISIHANASENRTMKGAEVYSLGLHKLESNFNVAKRENAVMMLEDNYETKYKGFDPNSVESYIMFEFQQDSYLDKSIKFADMVQQELVHHCDRDDRGVRQAGFWVLSQAACPSVLVEMGFVSNKEEERYLASEDGKAAVADAIFSALLDYKIMLTKKASNTQESGVETTTSTNSSTSSESSSSSTTATASTKENSTISTEMLEDLEAQPVFAVQIFSTRSELPVKDPTFKGLTGCKYIKDDKFYKYYYGELKTYYDAVKLKEQLQPKFKDCFVIALLNGKQIYVKDARAMVE